MKKLITLNLILLIYISLSFESCKSTQKLSKDKSNNELDKGYLERKYSEGFKISSFYSARESYEKFIMKLEEDYIPFEVQIDCGNMADCDILAASEAGVRAAQQVQQEVQGILAISTDRDNGVGGFREGQFIISVNKIKISNLVLSSLKWVKEDKTKNKLKVEYIYLIKKTDLERTLKNNAEINRAVKETGKNLDTVVDNVIGNIEKTTQEKI